MSLSKKDVENIAKLARLSFTEDKFEQLTKDLSNILSLFAEINNIDTTNITPMAHPLETVQPLRKDSVTETDQHEIFLAQAPDHEDDLFLVPQVIDEEK